MPEAETALRELASYANYYQAEFLNADLSEFGLDQSSLLDASPRSALKFFYRLYGFNRQGAPDSYRYIAISAIEKMDDSTDISPDELWEAFRTGCNNENIGINERLNEGVIKDVVELVNREGNLFSWVSEEVKSTGRLSSPYHDIVSVRGIGPKLARFFLRDAVWIAGLEPKVVKRDRPLLQPIDVWVRRVAISIWPELDSASRDHVSNKIAEGCETHDVSNAEFNQGAWYFGAQEMNGDADRMRDAIRQM